MQFSLEGRDGRHLISKAVYRVVRSGMEENKVGRGTESAGDRGTADIGWPGRDNLPEQVTCEPRPEGGESKCKGQGWKLRAHGVSGEGQPAPGGTPRTPGTRETLHGVTKGRGKESRASAQLP